MYYIYHARFQPFTKLHEAEINLLAQTIGPNDKIIIGIVGYQPQYIRYEDLDRTPQFARQFNFLNYWERVQMIDEFIERTGMRDVIPIIIPLPRPSQQVDEARHFLPREGDYKLCVSVVFGSEHEELMIEDYKSFYRIHIIDSKNFAPELKIISSELICSLIVLEEAGRIKRDIWKDMVNESVYQSVVKLRSHDRIIGNGEFTEEQAAAKLESLKRFAHDQSERSVWQRIDEYRFSETGYFVRGEVIAKLENMFRAPIVKARETMDREKTFSQRNAGLSSAIYSAKANCNELLANKLQELLDHQKEVSRNLIEKNAVCSLLNNMTELIDALIEETNNCICNIISAHGESEFAKLLDELKKELTAICNETHI